MSPRLVGREIYSDSSNRWVSGLFHIAPGVIFDAFFDFGAPLWLTLILRPKLGKSGSSRIFDFLGFGEKIENRYRAQNGMLRWVRPDFFSLKSEFTSSSKIWVEKMHPTPPLIGRFWFTKIHPNRPIFRKSEKIVENGKIDFGPKKVVRGDLDPNFFTESRNYIGIKNFGGHVFLL